MVRTYQPKKRQRKVEHGFCKTQSQRKKDIDLLIPVGCNQGIRCLCQAAAALFIVRCLRRDSYGRGGDSFRRL